MWKGLKLMLIILFGFGLVIGLLMIFILPPSRGIIKPLMDEEGHVIDDSIAEKIIISIQGVNQGMIIKGKHKDLPVLLLLHGGPGLSDYFLSTLYPTGLEEHFIVCYWDQRGTGLSYFPELDPKTMTKEQFILDALEVTRYLKDRFGQEKIYLMGHSWGTYLGLKLASDYPEYYHAYLAMSQIVNQIESERDAYQYMLNQFKDSNQSKMVETLEKYEVFESRYELNKYRMSMDRDKAMHSLGLGTMHEMTSVVSGLFFPSLRNKDYTMEERIRIWRGKAFSRDTNLLFSIDSFDARVDIPTLSIPIYFFAGVYDYTTTYALQYDYYEHVIAPKKMFFSFENSAHSPIFEEPSLAISYITDNVFNPQDV